MAGTCQLGQSSLVTPVAPSLPAPATASWNWEPWPMGWLIPHPRPPRFLPLPLTTGSLNLPGVPLMPKEPPCCSQGASHRAATHRAPA